LQGNQQGNSLHGGRNFNRLTDWLRLQRFQIVYITLCHNAREQLGIIPEPENKLTLLA